MRNPDVYKQWQKTRTKHATGHSARRGTGQLFDSKGNFRYPNLITRTLKLLYDYGRALLFWLWGWGNLNSPNSRHGGLVDVNLNAFLGLGFQSPLTSITPPSPLNPKSRTPLSGDTLLQRCARLRCRHQVYGSCPKGYFPRGAPQALTRFRFQVLGFKIFQAPCCCCTDQEGALIVEHLGQGKGFRV